MTTPRIPLPVIETLTRVQAFMQARGLPCYLVGGLLRDQLLERPLRYLNVDLAVPSGALAVSRELAASLGAAFVALDETAGSARVVVTDTPQRIELDVNDFRASTLDDDLRRRDFTINAIAIALEAWLQSPQQPSPLIDPLEGQQALRQQRLRVCFPGTFDEDPVRILRAFRFVSQLDLTLEPAAGPLMRRAVPALADVAGERIRDELVAMLETDRAADSVRALNEIRALDVIIPELIPGRGLDQGNFHHLDVLGHQLETVAQADRFLAGFAEFSPALREPLTRYCAEQPTSGRSRKALIKLAGLLHDVGKPARRTVEPDGEIWFLGHEETGAELVTGVTARLRLSNREAEMIHKLVLYHLRPGFLSREPQLTRRALYRFFKALGEDGPACLLAWWADRMATRGSKSRVDQIDQQRSRLEEMLTPYFFQAEEVVAPPRLVTGHELMAAFHLTPGPQIGELLGAIEEAQAEGRIRTPEDALAFAKARLGTRAA